jgi:protein O-GlcNAc transferase
VPVVTLAGSMHVGRVGVSLLNQIGREDLIAPDEDAFVAIASTLAGSAAELARSRASLRKSMAASSLCDGRRLAREFEAALFAAVGQRELVRAA